MYRLYVLFKILKYPSPKTINYSEHIRVAKHNIEQLINLISSVISSLIHHRNFHQNQLMYLHQFHKCHPSQVVNFHKQQHMLLVHGK